MAIENVDRNHAPRFGWGDADLWIPKSRNGRRRLRPWRERSRSLVPARTSEAERSIKEAEADFTVVAKPIGEGISEGLPERFTVHSSR